MWRDFGAIVVANLASFLGRRSAECLQLVWLTGLRFREEV